MPQRHCKDSGIEASNNKSPCVIYLQEFREQLSRHNGMELRNYTLFL